MAFNVTVGFAFGADPSADPGTWTFTNVVAPSGPRAGVVIRRGRLNEGQDRTEPSGCEFTLDNPGGVYTPYNPTSIRYPNIRANTPTRVQVDGETRYTGHSVWKPAFADGGGGPFADVPICDVEAAGPLRRLGQGTPNLKSPLRRAIPDSSPQAYWPLEDSPGSTRAASIPGSHVSPMFVDGTVSFGSVSDLAGSGSLPDLDRGGRLRGEVPSYTVGANPALTVDFWFKSSSAASTTHYPLEFAATASLNRFEVEVTSTALNVLVYDNLGAEQTSGGFSYTADFTDDNWHNVKIVAKTGAAASVDLDLYVDGTLRDSFNTGAAQFVGRVTGVTANPRSLAGGPLVSVGHIAVFNGNVTTSFYNAGLGHAGETAGTRIQRICSENDVPYLASGNEADTEPMGPQPSTLVGILRDCEATDGGILYETTGGKLAYLTRKSRYNPTVDLALTRPNLTPGFQPISDDQTTRNDVTVTRVGGSSAQFTDGVHIAAHGRYDGQVTINTASDGVLLNHAGWRVHLGTVEALRYPLITLYLHADPNLITTWLACDIGSRITISNPPASLPPDMIDLVVVGYTEKLDALEWTVDLVCEPTSPWLVAVWDTDRYDTSGSQLNGSHNSTTTSLSVEVFAGPLWVTPAELPTDFPFNIGAGGEQIRADMVGQVLTSNAFLFTDATGWSGQNGTPTWVTTPRVNPAYGSIQMTPAGTGVAEVRAASLIGGISVGASYLIGAWVRTPSAWASGHRAGINWHDGGGVLLSTSQISTVVLTAGTWTFLSGVFVAPASAAQARPWVNQQGAPTAGDIWHTSVIVLIPATTYNASPQTFTVTRSVNGVVKSHADNTAVSLWQPAVYAL